MVTAATHVSLITNDVVPGGALPVAAPGLRQFGLAEGLRSHGIDTTIIIPRHVADRHWSGQPAPTSEGTVILSAPSIREYLETRAPSVAVLTNSNQIDHLEGAQGCRLVYDFFAPKVLELVCHQDVETATDDLDALSQRKVRALFASDAILLNGEKKRPYVIAWLLQTGRDVREIPIISAPMCVPPDDRRRAVEEGTMQVGIAGYLQQWSLPRSWLQVLGAVLDTADVRLHVLLPPHWGGSDEIEISTELADLVDHPKTVRHETKTFSQFREFLSELDLVIDLFERTLEREYAMVTRTVVALTSGLPVVHPTFTEVAPFVQQYEAGWLVDVEDEERLRAVLSEVLASPDEVGRRARNAAKLAQEVFAPAVAVRGFVDLLRSWEQR